MCIRDRYVVVITLPPLRERGDDILLLLNHYLETFSEENDKEINGFTPEAYEVLSKYSWPGNIRELSNLIQRLSVLYPGETVDLHAVPAAMLPSGIQHLVDDSSTSYLSGSGAGEADNSYMDIVMSAKGVSAIGDPDLSLKETLNSVEKDMIGRALREVDGNVSMCARILKVQRTTLIERIKKYSLG